jgi:L-fuculose-phosphate aldolase
MRKPPKKEAADIVCVARKAYDAGLVDFGEGNMSIRLEGEKEMLITPTLNDYESLKVSDLVRVGFDGKIRGKHSRKPSSEHMLHSRIYLELPKVNCVIHTHSPYASVLAVLRMPLPVIFEEMAIFLGGDVKVSEYAMANTSSLGKAALKALDSRNACMLANHGVVSVGKNPFDAFKAAKLVEKMAMIYVGALKAGKPYEVPEKSVELFRKKHSELFSTT